MTILNDSAIVCQKWPGGGATGTEAPVFEREGITRLCYVRDPSSSSSSGSLSVFRSFLSRAADVLPGFADGLSRSEKKRQADIEERKQTLYLKMRNVSSVITRNCCSDI